MFNEESKRKLKEMGNIELYELGETVRTTQCPICLEHSKEGTKNCWTRSVFDALSRNTKIQVEKESTSLQNLCTLSEEDKDNAMDMKSGNTITGNP